MKSRDHLAIGIFVVGVCVGCEEPIVLVPLPSPAENESAELECGCAVNRDCSHAPVGDAQDFCEETFRSDVALAPTICFTPTADHVGLPYAMPPTCEPRDISSSDVGVEVCGCDEHRSAFGIPAGEDPTHANWYLAHDGSFAELDIIQDCADLATVTQCLPLNGNRTLFRTPASGDVTFATKCDGICSGATGSFNSFYCNPFENPPPGGDLQVCDFEDPPMPYQIYCGSRSAFLPGGITIVGDEFRANASCAAPDLEIDPPAIPLEITAPSLFEISVSDPLGDVVELDSAVVPVSGRMYVDRDHCESGSCTVRLLGISASVPTFELLGTNIVESSVRFAGDPVGGTIDDSGDIEFPSGIEFSFRGRRDGDVMREGTFVLDSDATGIVDDAAGTVAFDIALENDELHFAAEGKLRARFLARPPRAKLSVAPLTECSSLGGAFVPVDVSETTDPDDDLVSCFWRTDGIQTATHGDEEVLVPLGTHTITVAVTDQHGFFDTDTATATVTDTTAPNVDDFVFDGPACLWPPNHGYIVLRTGRDFDALVTDACDANPRLEVIDGSSSQPDNGLGDGDTENDVVVFSDRICLRAERQGNIDEGRIYTIQLAGVDASGNEGDPIVQVRVSHDQRPDDRCREIAVLEVVEDGDPACIPEPPLAPDGAAPPPAGGCTSTREGTSLLLLALFLARRRTRDAVRA